MTMPLDDAAESVWVAPSCTLWLYEHFLLGSSRGSSGSYHAWNEASNDREDLLNDFSDIGMSNKASSYRCSCGHY